MKHPVSVKLERCSISRVKELMNQAGERWNKDLVRELFSPTKVLTILCVPICSLGTMDILIWKHNPNGQYSVNSGYQMFRENGKKTKWEEGSSTKKEDDRKLWRKLWGLDIKRKI